MRRLPMMVYVLALVAFVAAPWQVVLAQDVDVQGAWVVAEVIDSDGNAVEQVLPGIFVFSGTHYSMMFAIGDGPRARYDGESATGEERVAAYDSFVANSGRYQVEGDKLTFRAFVAKDPNYMSDWPDNATDVRVSIEGNSMRWEWNAFGPTEGSVFVMNRVEGMAPPWDQD